jgi:hypothetical protein
MSKNRLRVEKTYIRTRYVSATQRRKNWKKEKMCHPLQSPVGDMKWEGKWYVYLEDSGLRGCAVLLGE